MGIDTIPIITFDENNFHVGEIPKGTIKEVEFNFTNTGTGTLYIEIVTSCKCADIYYPTDPIFPGQKGKIIALYDTTTQDLGEVKKTIDIISNTEPLVVEAFFNATVIPPYKKG